MKQEKTLPIWEDLPVPLQVRSAHGTAPFSRELLFRSVLPSGIEFDRAVEIVHQTEKLLLEEETKTVASKHIRNVVYNLLTKNITSDAAESYIEWRKFEKDGRPFILILCSAPGMGNEVLASSVAFRLGMQDCLNIDMLTGFAFTKNAPRISAPTTLRALLKRNSGKKAAALPAVNIRNKFKEYARQSPGVMHAAIRIAMKNNVSTILYGSSIIPGSLDLRTIRNGSVFTAVTIAASSKDELSRSADRLGLFTGKHASAGELRILWTIHEFMISEAVQNQIPIVHTVSYDAVVAKIVQICSNHLKKRMSKSGLLEDAVDTVRSILAGVHQPARSNVS